MKKLSILKLATVFLPLPVIGCGQLPERTVNRLPQVKEHDGAVLPLVNGQFFITPAGELHTSSASHPEYIDQIFPQSAAMKLNTNLAAVYWELIEPREGVFDFSLMDGLTENAREHRLEFVLLWFGSWKNTELSCVPAWLKKKCAGFFRAQTRCGEQRAVLGRV